MTTSASKENLENWLVWTLLAYEKLVGIEVRNETMPDELREWWEIYKEEKFSSAVKHCPSGMTFDQFVYWMRGFFDIPPNDEITDEQRRDIRKVYNRCFANLPAENIFKKIDIKAN